MNTMPCVVVRAKRAVSKHGPRANHASPKKKQVQVSPLLNERFDCFVRSASLIARACTQRENIRGNMICAA